MIECDYKSYEVPFEVLQSLLSAAYQQIMLWMCVVDVGAVTGQLPSGRGDARSLNDHALGSPRSQKDRTAAIKISTSNALFLDRPSVLHLA